MRRSRPAFIVCSWDCPSLGCAVFDLRSPLSVVYARPIRRASLYPPESVFLRSSNWRCKHGGRPYDDASFPLTGHLSICHTGSSSRRLLLKGLNPRGTRKRPLGSLGCQRRKRGRYASPSQHSKIREDVFMLIRVILNRLYAGGNGLRYRRAMSLRIFSRPPLATCSKS